MTHFRLYIFIFIVLFASFPAKAEQNWPEIRNPQIISAEDSYGLIQKQMDAAENNRASLLPALPSKEKEEKPNNESGIPQLLTLSSLQPEAVTPKSFIEKQYTERTNDNLQLHGGLVSKVRTASVAKTNERILGRVDDSYVLQPGDQIELTRRGIVNDRVLSTISADGTLAAADLAPLSVAGKTLGELKTALNDEAAKRAGLELSANLHSLRQRNVLVLGHVTKPGQKTVPASSSVWDAITQAGNIRESGSWRQVKLIRAGKNYTIDLYPFLTGTGDVAAALQLQDGDKIIVPPLGPTFALTGDTLQKGIYEMKPRSFTYTDAIALAGGAWNKSGLRILASVPDESGHEEPINITAATLSLQNQTLKDGTILFFQQSEMRREKTIRFEGAIANKGLHLIDNETALSKLLTRADLTRETYPLFGVISRQSANGLGSEMMGFSPVQVVSGTADIFLQQNDTVYFLPARKIAALETTDEEDDLVNALADTDAAPLPTQVRAFVRDNLASVQGGVRQAGLYPIATGTTLDELIRTAGALTRRADKSRIEVTRRVTDSAFMAVNFLVPPKQGVEELIPENKNELQRSRVKFEDAGMITLNAGDTVRVYEQRRDNETKQFVTIGGAVKSPGRYDLQAGDRLSTLIERAGGITAQAYPRGTVFSRESERQREAMRYQASARDLELRLSSLMSSQDEKKQPSDEEISTTRDLINQMKQAMPLGRITVETDPERLKKEAESDILLEAGDRIFIPQTPATVRVAGEVLSPAALQFKTDKDVGEYIKEAGGLTYYADEDRAFVVLPDGSARPYDLSSWTRISSDSVPAGSIIFVPRDPKPFSFIDSAREISQILSNLAITGFFIQDLQQHDIAY